MSNPLAANQRVHREGTLEAYQHGVELSIQVMHNRLGDPLTVDDLADAAFMSRFHFTRVFSQVTHVSPGRFLAAVRMQEAKRLLLKTERSVTDVSLDVGYNSLGTFTRIFADFVGFPPVRYRQLSRSLLRLTLDQVARFLPSYHPGPKNAPITGDIVCQKQLTLVTVAMFSETIPRSHPIECVCLKESLQFSFNHKPRHGCHVYAVGLVQNATLEDAFLANHEKLLIGVAHLSSNIVSDSISFELRPKRIVEPPIVVAFPLFIADQYMNQALSNSG